MGLNHRINPLWSSWHSFVHLEFIGSALKRLNSTLLTCPIHILLKVKDISARSTSTCFSIQTFWSHPSLFSCRIWLLMCVHSWQHLSSFACRHDSVVLGSLTEGLLLTCGAGHGGPVLYQHPLGSLHHGSLLHVDRTGRHRTQNSVKACKSKAKAVMISFSSFC